MQQYCMQGGEAGGVTGKKNHPHARKAAIPPISEHTQLNAPCHSMVRGRMAVLPEHQLIVGVGK